MRTCEPLEDIEHTLQLRPEEGIFEAETEKQNVREVNRVRNVDPAYGSSNLWFVQPFGSQLFDLGLQGRDL